MGVYDMLFHDESKFQIYFGDATDAMYPDTYLTWHEMPLLLAQPQIKPIVEQLRIDTLFFLHQVHGSRGYTIGVKEKSLKPFAQDGDYLITNERAVGLGVVTADCLPVICVDTKNNSIGIAHAGWRGALAGVVRAMVDAMQKSWQTERAQCQFFLGPSAQRCCYQVGEEFQQYLAPYVWGSQVIEKKMNDYFFDLPLLVRYQLRELGIDDNAIHTEYNICTICNDRFYSYRRGMLTQTASLVGRQMTIVALKKAVC